MNVRCRHLLKIFTYNLLKSSVNFSSFLNLIGCKNLENLPSDICELKYLYTLDCSHCKKLKIFPEIKEDMEKLRILDLSVTSIQELPSSVERLKGLQYLKLFLCDSLVSIADSICNLTSLKTLDIRFCKKLKKLPENLERLLCLEKFYAVEIRCQLPSLSGLCSLKELFVSGSKLRQGAIRSDISRLSSLLELDLSNCMLYDGEIPTEIYQLSMLKVLELSFNFFSRLPAGFSQLSQLRVLGLSHCYILQEIPELPSSLRDIELHESACMETISTPPLLSWERQLWRSFLNCFKSEVQV